MTSMVRDPDQVLRIRRAAIRRVAQKSEVDNVAQRTVQNYVHVS